MADDAPILTDAERCRYLEALETLPLLTRTVFMLASRNNFSNAEIGLCCGISEQEVQVHVVGGLRGIGDFMRGRRRLTGSVRRALLPYRDAWAAARAREGDRRLAPWLSPELKPRRRGVLDWLAWAFERITR